jgi:nucleoside-diphosphate-sugar epimerase
LRLAGIYGPARHHLLDQVRAGTGEIAGSGAPHLNLAHRDDISAAVMATFTAPDSLSGEIFNVADDAAAPKAEVVRWLAEQLGRPAPRFTGGAASVRRGFASPPDRIISNARLKAQLGWRPLFPSFQEGYAAILSA